MIHHDIWNELLRPVDRRTFLKALGTAGVGLAAAGSLPAVRRYLAPEGSVSETRVAMGTYVTVTAVHPSRDAAHEGIAAAFAEMDRLIPILSRHDPRAPLYHLNQTGFVTDVPPELWEVFRASQDLRWSHRWAFNIFALPLVEAYRAAMDRGEKYPYQLDRDFVERCNLGNLDISSRRREFRFKADGTKISFDGIAKGYIVDRMSEALVAHGIGDHLVDAGGDMRASGSRPGSRPWRIAVEDPSGSADFPDVIALGSSAVATSGNHGVYWESDSRFLHILDPLFAVPPAKASVSVIAPTAMEADALATAVFAQASRQKWRWIEKSPGFECLVIEIDGIGEATRGWPSVL